MKKVSSFNDMSYYGGDAFYQPTTSKSVHSALPSVAEGPPPDPQQVRPSPSLQQQLALADKRSKASLKAKASGSGSKEEIHGSEHGGTSALEALMSAGYISSAQPPDKAQYPQRLTLPPIQGSTDTVRELSHQGSQLDIKINQSSGLTNMKKSAEEIAAQAFMNPLPPGMIEVPGESLHRKMIALMALDRAVVAEGPYCSRPVGPYCANPVREALPSVTVSGGDRQSPEGISIGSGGGLSIASQSNVRLDALLSAKVKDGSCSDGRAVKVDEKGASLPAGSSKKVPASLSFPPFASNLSFSPHPNQSYYSQGSWKFADATQAVGSLMYMAPELFNSHRQVPSLEFRRANLTVEPIHTATMKRWTFFLLRSWPLNSSRAASSPCGANLWWGGRLQWRSM